MIPAELGMVARSLFNQRRVRDALFGEHVEGLGEPAWDMLLMLAAGEGAGIPITRDALITAGQVPDGVAELHLEWLVERKLAVLTPATNADTVAVVLGERGRAVMLACLG